MYHWGINVSTTETTGRDDRYATTATDTDPATVGGATGDGPTDDADRAERAAYMGRQICLGFVHHDRREWEATVRAFYAVDRHQFAHLSDAEALEAATAYAAALWAKDAVEAPHVRDDGGLDRAALDAADWRPVEACLARRAEIVGMPRAYATATTAGWRKHKTGGDYWTPHMRAQRHEIRAAMGDPAYPDKQENGTSGFGPLAARYLAGIELHDMKTERHWERAADVMAGYYEEILRAHDKE